MASNPPGKCCLKHVLHEGEPSGAVHDNLFGLVTYEAGDKSSKKVIVIGTDIFGYDFKNTQLTADSFAKRGFYVLVPDIIGNDPLDVGKAFGGDGSYFNEWRSRHTPAITGPIYHEYLSKVKKQLGNVKLFSIGYCFGASYVVLEAGKQGLLDAAAVAHPSYVTIDTVELIAKPLLISAAQTDKAFPSDLRHATEDILIKNNVAFELNLFSHVQHGFAIKGDTSLEPVRFAKERSFEAAVSWFDRFA